MKIKNISCTQFAGIRDRSISFEGGINLIYGKNESGKSTLVNLLSRTLFQNARIDGRSDKEFKELYLPGARKGSAATGDFADGRITFDTDSGTYTLTKEWGSDARCMLSTPDGVIRDQKKIQATLKEVLLYGEGVYSDMLFSSQRNTDVSLQTLLDASKKTDAKQEITDAVSQAFSESDGITADAIEQAINQKIEEIAGKHWDAARCMPVRKAERWAKDRGEILNAYYDLEDAREVLKTITQLEKEADAASADDSLKDREAHIAEEALARFQTFAGQLTLRSERRKTIDRLEKESARIRAVLSAWPQLATDLGKAAALKTEKEHRDLLDKYESAKKLAGEIEALRIELGNRACPTDREISDVKAAQRRISSLENKLCGMNLNAAIKMLGGNTAHITSLRTGRTLDITDDLVPINEAVKITVPGVMELQLSPADVNAAEIETAIAGQKKLVGDVFSRYHAESLEALEQLAKQISDGKAKMDMLSGRLAMVLGTTDYAALEAAANAVTGEVRSRESIDGDILCICGGSDIVRFIAAKETIIQGYEKDYGSVDGLKARAYDMEAELKTARESVAAVQDIPGEYANISNPEGYLAMLQEDLKTKRERRENALKAKSTTAGRLENYKETLSGDPAVNVENAERIFEEKKALLGHWMHIAQVFAQQKQRVRNTPMQDISDSFTRYLGMISDGKISSQFPDPEKLNMSIYSGSSLMDYGKLSEGTKETVSLAFRLAVLDHLFPNGGGVIVLDDPFANMDADRMAQSCELMKECATRHQVIFLTCREEYFDLLGGNVIRM